jgi:hypothetical protein
MSELNGNGLKRHSIDDDRYYDPSFYKLVTYEVESEYYPLIGEFISVFNALEDSLSEELIEYLDNDKIPNVGWLVISDMSYSSKVILWEKLILNVGHLILKEECKTEKEKKQMEAFIKKVEDYRKEYSDLGEIRNCIAHGNWQSMNTDFYVKTKTKADKKGVTHQHIEIKKEEFDGLIDRVEKFEKDFLGFNKWFQTQMGILIQKAPEKKTNSG